MKFKLEIELGNDAMQDRDDVGHELYRLSKRLMGAEAFEPGDGELVRDANGNTVGKWEVTEDREPLEVAERVFGKNAHHLRQQRS